jgi:hypothetical protein
MKTLNPARPVLVLHWLQTVLKFFKKIDKSDPSKRLTVWEDHAQEQLAQNRAAARISSHWR